MWTAAGPSSYKRAVSIRGSMKLSLNRERIDGIFPGDHLNLPLPTCEIEQSSYSQYKVPSNPDVWFTHGQR